MKIKVELSEDEHGTPIEFANAIMNSDVCRSLNDFETLVDHLNVEVRRYRREQRERQFQGNSCTP